MLRLAPGLGICLLLTAGALADAPPTRVSRALLERGRAEVEAGVRRGSPSDVARGLVTLRRARELLAAEPARPGITPEVAAQAEADLWDAEKWIAWAAGEWERLATAPARPPEPPVPAPAAPEPAAPEEGDRPPSPDVPAPPEGASPLTPWIREIRAAYAGTPAPAARAVLAREIAERAGVIGLPALLALFRSEEDPAARAGIHDALVQVGTSRVATGMAEHARQGPEAERLRSAALEVVCRCLARPEDEEPERPFCRAIRAFHKLEDRALSLGILDRLDEMGKPGVAALGEVLYLEDFGCHAAAIELLSTKQDRRAVPPLVHLLNRFAFDYREQYPAHQALLKMGWHAVPELIARLDDKAAGIWISWTLRKISGETMGTTKRKWDDWWKHERVKHPEVEEEPAETPAETTPGEGLPGR